MISSGFTVPVWKGFWMVTNADKHPIKVDWIISQPLIKPIDIPVNKLSPPPTVSLGITSLGTGIWIFSLP